MSTVRVRPAEERDAPVIALLVSQLGYPSTAEQVRARLKHLEGHPDFTALVAEQQGRVCGVIGLHVFPGYHRDGLHGYITALVVDEGLRRSGVATRLLAASDDWFRQRGVKHVNLTSALHREDAHRFYIKRGYELSGHRFHKAL